MPKDNREIHNAIRLPGNGKDKSWKPGKSSGGSNFKRGAVVTDPDVLAAAKTQDELDELLRAGVISGNWKSTLDSRAAA